MNSVLYYYCYAFVTYCTIPLGSVTQFLCLTAITYKWLIMMLLVAAIYYDDIASCNVKFRNKCM